MTVMVAGVSVALRQEFGGYYAHSPELPGLSVWGDSMSQVCVRIESAVMLLRRLAGARAE